MKKIPAILILIWTACSNSTGRQICDVDKGNNTSAKNHTDIIKFKDTLRTSGEREYIDSANFHIIRGKYVSGSKFIEVYQNKSTKLDHWKEYYENGQLKEEGIMTNANHICIGVWKYYSYAGKIDSIINHDKIYTVPYSSALKIAEMKGFKMPDIEVTLKIDSLKTCWQIARWTENENHDGQVADVILIDTKTAKVTRPDYQLMSVY